MRQVWLGQSVQLVSPVLTGDGGAPATVSGVTFTLFKPSGATQALAGVQDEATGEWVAIGTVDEVGRWRAEVVTAGPLVGVDVIWFEVKARDGT